VRVTSKGQVTIPKQIREKLGVKPGDEVGFREEGQSVILENADVENAKDKFKRRIQKAQALVAQMLQDGRMEPLGMSVDEYMDMIRGYSEDADDPGFKRHP
jgi:AbrB family looped-hinge helix DNA binding protein